MAVHESGWGSGGLPEKERETDSVLNSLSLFALHPLHSPICLLGILSLLDLVSRGRTASRRSLRKFPRAPPSLPFCWKHWAAY